MGFSLSWAAVRGVTPSSVQELLSLQGTGSTKEIPESDIAAAQLPGEWYIVVSQHDLLEFTKEKTLEKLSILGEVIACSVEEHVMSSFAAGWRNGHCSWSVYHDCNGREGIYQLDVNGEPPSALAEIRDRLRSKQEAAGGKKAGVDYIFDVPVELARSVTGYRHDQNIPGLQGIKFEVLVRNQPGPKQPWFKKLFGV
jgi:hypothetical protein